MIWSTLQAIWCYEMVQMHTVNLKSHLIAQVMKNCIIHSLNKPLVNTLSGKSCICTSFEHDLPLPREKNPITCIIHCKISLFLGNNLLWVFHIISKFFFITPFQKACLSTSCRLRIFNVLFCYYILCLQVNLNLQSSTLMYIHLAQFVCHFWMKKKTGDLLSL